MDRNDFVFNYAICRSNLVCYELERKTKIQEISNSYKTLWDLSLCTTKHYKGEKLLKTKQELATYQRKRYHSNENHRKMHIKSSTKWIKNNRERVNEVQRKRYARLSMTKKKKRLAKVRKMRKLGLWS